MFIESGCQDINMCYIADQRLKPPRAICAADWCGVDRPSDVESTLFHATADLWNYQLDEKSGKNQRPEQPRGQIFQSKDLVFITIL